MIETDTSPRCKEKIYSSGNFFNVCPDFSFPGESRKKLNSQRLIKKLRTDLFGGRLQHPDPTHPFCVSSNMESDRNM